jgi:hypothetical protein
VAGSVRMALPPNAFSDHMVMMTSCATERKIFHHRALDESFIYKLQRVSQTGPMFKIASEQHPRFVPVGLMPF